MGKYNNFNDFYNENKEALEKLYVELFSVCDLDTLKNDFEHDIITLNECRNGRDVVWYMDTAHNMAMYCDTFHILTNEEIEKELL